MSTDPVPPAGKIVETAVAIAYNYVMTTRLTPEQEAIVQQAVASGLASSAEEFLSVALERWRAELNVAPAQGAAFDQWVRDNVVPAHHAFMKDPSTGKTADEVRKELFGE